MSYKVRVNKDLSEMHRIQVKLLSIYESEDITVERIWTLTESWSCVTEMSLEMSNLMMGTPDPLQAAAAAATHASVRPALRSRR